MRKILLAACLMLAFVSGADAQRLTILHVNDTHSHFEPVRSGPDAGLGGLIERAAYVDSVRRADGKRNVLLLHAGDFSQGSSYFTVLKGDLEIAEINAMKYDCITLGNHEFDNGVEELGRRLAMLKCPVVCANYDFSSFEAGKYIKPYTIVRRGGMKIGIIGLLTDITKVVERTISDRLPALDVVSVTNKWASYLKNEEKCDLVIVLSHLGYDESEAFESMSDQMLVGQTRNVDLIVGGHSHTFLEKMESAPNPDGKMVPIVQDGCWGLNVGNLKVW